jgi:TRAP-type C4-dicarboxylate transport system substrate-binding protein
VAQYDLARSGAADIALVMHGTMPGRFPLTELAGLPFLSPDPVRATTALEAALTGWLAPEHEGVRVLFLAASAPLAVHARQPLRNVADFNGRRIRVPGRVAAALLSALGAEPVPVLPMDVAETLRSGAVDGVALTYQGAGFHQLAPLVRYSTELNAGTVTFGLVMNPDSYARLPAELRSTVDEVLGASGGRRLAQALARDAADGKAYMRRGGVTIIELQAHERQAFDVALGPVVAQTVASLDAQGLPAQAAYDALRGAVHA